MNAKQRNYVQSIVDTLVFVEEKNTVDKCRCLKCDKVALKHYVTNCKHIFCTSCVKQLLYHMCPICGDVEITEVKKDEQFEKRVHDLIVDCPYKDRGCFQTIPLHNYKDHEYNCSFSTNNLIPKVHRENDSHESTNEEDESSYRSPTTMLPKIYQEQGSNESINEEDESSYRSPTSMLPKIYQEKGSNESTNEKEEGGSKVKMIIKKFEEKTKNQNVLQKPPVHTKPSINKAMKIDAEESETDDEFEDATDQIFLSKQTSNESYIEGGSADVKKEVNDNQNALQTPTSTQDTDVISSIVAFANNLARRLYISKQPSTE